LTKVIYTTKDFYEFITSHNRINTKPKDNTSKKQMSLSKTQVKVDGCAIIIGERCDFLVRNDVGREFFVELKGKDILKACKQLEISINQLSTQKPRKAFVISSRVPPAVNTKIQKEKRRFLKYLQTQLLVKNKQHTEILS